MSRAWTFVCLGFTLVLGGCSSSDEATPPTADAAAADSSSPPADATVDSPSRPLFDGAPPRPECDANPGPPCSNVVILLSPVTGAACTFTWTKGTSFDPARANVVLLDASIDGGGQVFVPMGPQDGWTYDDQVDPTQVTLHGTPCTAYGASSTTKVELVMSCAAIPPPPKC
jgi:hypothetical protein